jgi:hypothetical protein
MSLCKNYSYWIAYSFFLLSSLIIRNFTFNMDKLDDQCLNPALIYYFLVDKHKMCIRRKKKVNMFNIVEKQNVAVIIMNS